MTAPAELGQLLRIARQVRGLTVEDLSLDAHIPVAHVEALEAGQLNAVPGAMYRRAEARAYAEVVGLDPSLVLLGLQQALDAPPAAAPFASLASDHIEWIAPEPLEPPMMEVPPAAVINTRNLHGHRHHARLALALVVGSAALLLEQAVAPTLTESVRPSQLVDIALPRTPAPKTPVPPADAAAPAQPEATQPEPSKLEAAKPEAAKPMAATPARSSNRLVITTTPPGARVTVNGIGWGTTPVTIRYVPSGPQRIRVVKDRFRSEERVVDVTDGHPGSIVIALRPLSRPTRDEASSAATKSPARGQ
jgi:hypothetical protein